MTRGPCLCVCPGVLWSYSTAEEPLAFCAPTILFPNVSSADQPCRSSKAGGSPGSTYLSPGCAHLFAAPTVVLNGRVYVAASLRQFCLYPLDRLDDNGVYLLPRPGLWDEWGPKETVPGS